ncbi:MAG: hypothetical protein M0Z31_12430 [Clostridia bacterium]|nr:hypothetical protein [Clostridia bacterium]
MKPKNMFIIILISIFSIAISIAVYTVISTGSYSKKTNNQFTFYYQTKEQFKIVNKIINQHIDKTASVFFPTESRNSKVKVYLKNKNEAKLDSILSQRSSINGYYLNNKIILRTDRAIKEGPGGNQVIFAKPDAVKTFYHEYVHHLLLKTINKELPRWFEEGLAEHFAHQIIGQPSEKIKPLGFEVITIDENWTKYPSDELYPSSEFYIKKIISRWGEKSIKETIISISEGDSFITALQKSTGQKYTTVINELSK